MQDSMKGNNKHIVGKTKGEEEQNIENLFEEVMVENFLNLMRKRYTNTWNTEGPNQEEPKEAHSNTYHN